MELKMYEFFEADMKLDWVCATSTDEAISIYSDLVGKGFIDEWLEAYDGNKDMFVREMSMDEKFTYYHDCITPERDTIKNLIEKYCDKPDMFATADF
ncbi:hypothetical protein [Gracilibacillus saliphilus]|uniref:hypothetical protein n=1 Tax=Gracilibacillus saliphilus TaxID=543890 RepID=UPI0013D0B1AE|nr:hypothetical protein [Gracilibacillus saliphilus]